MLTLNVVFLILQSLLTLNLFLLCTPSVFCFCPINSCQYSKGSKIKQLSRYSALAFLCNCCNEGEQIGQNQGQLTELPWLSSHTWHQIRPQLHFPAAHSTKEVAAQIRSSSSKLTWSILTVHSKDHTLKQKLL